MKKSFLDGFIMGLCSPALIFTSMRKIFNHKPKTYEEIQKETFEALSNDWKKVSQDMKKAIDKGDKELKDKK